MHGAIHTIGGLYRDIVPVRRIVYVYDMYVGGDRISVSLGTVALEPEGNGTKRVHTEQGAFLDGFDDPASREGGMGSLLDALGTMLETRSADPSAF